jgi:hypothetical protein
MSVYGVTGGAVRSCSPLPCRDWLPVTAAGVLRSCKLDVNDTRLAAVAIRRLAGIGCNDSSWHLVQLFVVRAQCGSTCAP